MKRLLGAAMVMIALVAFTAPAMAASPKAKFYDFSDQLIDGEIKKPTTLYTDSRTQVKFDRLLSLKKSFIKALLATSKEQVFK
jgi:hypothetical protein